MTDDIFWGIIDKINWTANHDSLRIAPAVEALSALSVNDIFQFQEILSHKLYALDARKYAEHIGKSAYRLGHYFSGDTFLYVRCCVVANGQQVYNYVLANPQEMPKDMDFEPLLYIAPKAYLQKTGNPQFDFTPSLSYETFSNTAGWNRNVPTYISELVSAA